MKNLIATTTNGMHILEDVKVTSIGVYINRSFTNDVNETTIAALLDAVKISKQMQIYNYCVVEKLNGKIDALDGTPLYTNGQQTVIKLTLDGVVIWDRYNKEIN